MTWRFNPYTEKIREIFETELTINDAKMNKKIKRIEKKKIMLSFARATINHLFWRMKTKEILNTYTDIIVDMDGTLYKENTFRTMINSLFKSSIASDIFMEYQKESETAFTIQHIKMVEWFRKFNANGWVDEVINSVKEFNIPLLNFLENEIKRGIRVHMSTLNIIEVADKMAERIGLNFFSVHGSGDQIISIVPMEVRFNNRIIKTISKADIDTDTNKTILITDASFDIYAMARFPTIFILNKHDMFNTKLLKPYLYKVKFGEGIIG
ncbi:hypothetical protein J7J90_04110 [Candidatus Micrarchaeota archaeon]|nr:hypothetical protein [Candidatus Micrarchaeota archaeon]